MKTKVFLMSLALSCLWSCQQSETAELTNDQTIKFTGVVVGEGGLTRSGGTTIDVISMRTDVDDTFTVFNLNEDTRSWEDFGEEDEVVFYAHYPRLPEKVAYTDTRVLKAGTEDYLFGEAKAVAGQQQVCLEFKRVMVPMVVEVLDEEGDAYEDALEVSALVSNQGVQNLKDGSVTALDQKEYTKFESLENSRTRSAKPIIALNLLPQRIEKGTPFQVQLGNGSKYTATVAETVLLKSGVNYKAIVWGNKVVITIFDGSIPL